jgi:hypothetical protein
MQYDQFYFVSDIGSLVPFFSSTTGYSNFLPISTRPSTSEYNSPSSYVSTIWAFEDPPTSEIVSFHAHYLFKIKHTNSPSHFHLFNDTKKKDTSSLTYASFQPTKFFRM